MSFRHILCPLGTCVLDLSFLTSFLSLNKLHFLFRCCLLKTTNTSLSMHASESRALLCSPAYDRVWEEGRKRLWTQNQHRLPYQVADKMVLGTGRGRGQPVSSPLSTLSCWQFRSREEKTVLLPVSQWTQDVSRLAAWSSVQFSDSKGRRKAAMEPPGTVRHQLTADP